MSRRLVPHARQQHALRDDLRDPSELSRRLRVRGGSRGHASRHVLPTLARELHVCRGRCRRHAHVRRLEQQRYVHRHADVWRDRLVDVHRARAGPRDLRRHRQRLQLRCRRRRRWRRSVHDTNGSARAPACARATALRGSCATDRRRPPKFVTRRRQLQRIDRRNVRRPRHAVQPGVGACLRYGTVKCNTLGTGTECSVVAAMPTTEMCNQIDDNCNGSVDEPFTTLGQQCSVGIGVCTRYGTNVCRADGTGVACSATPGTATTGDLQLPRRQLRRHRRQRLPQRSPASTTRTPTAARAATTARLRSIGAECDRRMRRRGRDRELRHALQRRRVRSQRPRRRMAASSCSTPRAIYVSTNDMTSVDDATCGLGPTGTGAGNHPCKTITFGLARATSTRARESARRRRHL